MHRSLLSSSLVASGGPGVDLTIPLTQAALHNMGEYESIVRIGSLPFSKRLGFTTWEDWTIVHSMLTSAGATMTSSHLAYARANCYVAEDESWLVSAEFMDGYWAFLIAGGTEDIVARLAESLTLLAGDSGLNGEDVVSMTIWSEHPMGGGHARYGSMRVDPWQSAMANYPAATRSQIESLADGLPDKSDGGLVVFGGPAGTGKTRAIEALCHAWAGDATLGVVVDSDKLLASAAYLTDVITAAGPDSRQVIVAEDADEMICDGPKSHLTSKLLNIADGLVGRLAGAGTLFVVSANLPMDKIAPYITRPGRCAAAVEFELFSPADASAWLADRGVEVDVDEHMTLAQMFELVRRPRQATQPEHVASGQPDEETVDA